MGLGNNITADKVTGHIKGKVLSTFSKGLSRRGYMSCNEAHIPFLHCRGGVNGIIFI